MSCGSSEEGGEDGWSLGSSSTDWQGVPLIGARPPARAWRLRGTLGPVGLRAPGRGTLSGKAQHTCPEGSPPPPGSGSPLRTEGSPPSPGYGSPLRTEGSPPPSGSGSPLRTRKLWIIAPSDCAKMLPLTGKGLQ